MQKLKWAFLVIISMILVFFIISPDSTFFSQKLGAALAASSPVTPPSQTKDRAYKSRAPTYVIVQMPLLKPLITGETGTFEVSAHLRRNKETGSLYPEWNPNAETPLVIWIAAPEDSGIEFLGKDHPERPRRHIMVKFDPSPAPQLTATVAYHVKKHTSAHKHQFWMEIYGQLAHED